MSRAALLPAGADPFLNAFWLRHYATVWADEVDELRVQVCAQSDPRIIAFLAGIAAAIPHTVITFTARMDHGIAIGNLLAQTPHSHVLLLEDDAFVRRKGAVNAAFARIERNEADIVACPRASGTPDVIDAAASAFGTLVSETGEEGPAFWPCFYFGRKDHLLATDRHYGAAAWQPGDLVPGLDYRAGPTTAADTFTGTSFQLRRMGLRVHVEAEYRANLAKMNGWADPPWFHVGSLSSGYGYYFCSGISETDRTGHARAMEGDHHDWHKRFSWWQRVSETTELPEIGDAYRVDLDAFQRAMQLDQAKVDEWRHAFDRLVTW